MQNESNGIKFTVHKHFAYGEEWLLTCRELGVELMDLHTEDMEEAKENAIYKMIELLGKAAQKYNKAIVELSI